MMGKQEDENPLSDFLKNIQHVVRISNTLLNNPKGMTAEQISKDTGLRVNMVNRVLYDLFGKKMVSGERTVLGKEFTYVWRPATYSDLGEV